MPRRRPLAILALALAAVLWASACSVTSPIALEVDGTTLERSTFVGEMESFAANPTALQALYGGPTEGEAPGTYSTSFSAYLLSLHVIEAAVARALDDRGIEVTDDDRAAVLQQATAGFGFPASLDELDGFERTVVDILAGQQSLVAVVEGEVTSEEALDARFQELREESGEVTCSSHILIRAGTGQGTPTPEEVAQAEADIEAVRTQLADGADFATLAVEYSDDTSAADGGALGCHPAGTFVPEFDEALQAAPVGEVVEVTTQFGYHFIVATERRPLERADVEEQLTSSLQEQVQQAAQAELQAVMAGVDVEVDGQFGRWDAEALQVVPPEGPLPAGGGSEPLLEPAADGA